MVKSHPLDGLSRPAASNQPVRNPVRHSPASMQNRIQAEVIAPDGTIKQRVDHFGNIMLHPGMDFIMGQMCSGTAAASSIVRIGAIGTDSTAAASTQAALFASTATVSMGASLSASHSQSRTAAYLMTFASNNPAGAAAIHEVGLFYSTNLATNTNSGNGIARSVLGTDSINKGASDEIRMTYQLIASTV